MSARNFEAELAAVRLQPNDLLSVTLAEGDDLSFVSGFVRKLLSDAGLTNQFVLLHQGRRLEALGDDELAAIGLQRAGSWRTRPPLL